jgi:choline kinase
MKAIVLSAGQGRRLLPLTAESPKCLIPVDGARSSLELQLRGLARAGIRRATVLVGFGADQVEAHLAATPVPGIEVETLFNPFYAVADNLVTCWLASQAMDEDFVLLNGDTLFEDAVLERVLHGRRAPISVTIDHKAHYDDDDMKVSLDGMGRLVAVGKNLKAEQVDGESIGLLAFRGRGVTVFREALGSAIRGPRALRSWYLSIVNALARSTTIETTSIRGLWWREIDSPEDLAEVRAAYAMLAEDTPARARVAR